MKFLVIFIFLYCCVALAHDNQTVHPAITDKAFGIWARKDSVLDNLGINLTQTFADTSSAELNAAGALTVDKWLRLGSITEDEDEPSRRCFAHFYNPASSGHNLTDPVFFLGAPNSFEWASVGEAFTTQEGGNKEDWTHAREYYLKALTAPTKTERDAGFAHTFYALGKVVHLLEDLSQPDHVRNDAHVINGTDTPKLKHGPEARWIENYGQLKGVDIIKGLNDLAPLDWRASGFSKLEDFWDRKFYHGEASVLDADASGAAEARLGLAEFINGNFLGEDASYKELTIPFAWHHFEHPSLADTNLKALTGTTGARVGFVGLDSTWTSSATSDASPRTFRSLFLRKEKSGIVVEKHSMLYYSTVYTTKRGKQQGPMPSVTINSPSVLEEYHRLILAKAIEYSAGLMDYFFRGKMDVRITWDKDADNYNLEIENQSGQPFKGGQFTLYTDDGNGLRDSGQVLDVLCYDGSAWGDDSLLEDGDTVTATFQASAQPSKGYTLVYKGSIGVDGNNEAADPIDTGMALAAYSFQILRFNITWDVASDIDLYLVDPDGHVIAYYNRNSDLGELDNDDRHGTGPENITLKRLVDGDYQVWVNYYADHYYEDDEGGAPTSINVTLNTYFNAASEIDSVSFTLNEGNGGSSHPAGVSGPNTQASWYVRKLVKIKNGLITAH